MGNEVTILALLHSKLSISEGMARPILNVARAIGKNANIIVVGDELGAETWCNPVKKIVEAPHPRKNPAVDFLLGVLGRYSAQRKQVQDIIQSPSNLIVGYRASPFAPKGSILLKSDLFSENYRRRVAFCLSHKPTRLPIECGKLALAKIQEALEFRKFSQVLLHSEVERRGRRRAAYLPIITNSQKCVPAKKDILENGKVLVVGYQFSDPIANSDSELILKQVLRETTDPSRIFYLGAETHLLSEDQQATWVEDYDALLQSFSIAIYARSVCSGAHNKLVDLLRNGCAVYCVSHMEQAFASRCRWLLPLETYRATAGRVHAVPYDPDQFRRDVDQFLEEEAGRFRDALEALVSY